jgi:hypothetical protein
MLKTNIKECHKIFSAVSKFCRIVSARVLVTSRTLDMSETSVKL